MATQATIDTSAAQAYEQYLVPAFQGPQAVEAVNVASPQPGEHALDVACGTGIAVRLAAPRVAPGGRVAGLDIDPAMIALARTLAGDVSGAPIDWHCASAMAMPFDEASFDLVFCLQGLQFLPDCTAGLAEIRRVMKPGARLTAIVWDDIAASMGQHAVVQALKRRNVDPAPMLKANALGDATRLNTYAAAAGFTAVNIRAVVGEASFASTRQFMEAMTRGGVASRVAISKVPAEQRAAFDDDVAAQLRPFEDGTGVRLPARYLIMTARK